MNKIAKRMVTAAGILCGISAVAAMVILVCILLVPFDYYWAVGLAVGLSLVLATLLTGWFFYWRIRHVSDAGDMSLTDVYGPQISHALERCRVGLILVDEKGIVTYQSDYMAKVGVAALEKPIGEVTPQLGTMFESGITNNRIDFNNHSFDVELIKSAGLFILKDESELRGRQRDYRNAVPFIAFARVDNYADRITAVGEVAVAKWMNQLSTALYGIGEGRYVIRSVRDDTYIIIGENDQPLEQVDNELSIVRQVREMNNSISTISVGVARNFPDLASACEEAYNNVELAGARGGDQALISEFGKAARYVGGTTESKATINRARIRLLSKELIAAIQESELVLTMGHTYADFDSIGACLGVKSLCNTLGVKCRIVYVPENTEQECRKAFEDQYRDHLDELTIDCADALDAISSKTLVVLVDVSAPERLVYPNFISYDSDVRVALIDHHRQSERTFKHVVFNGSDSSASSACELLAEYIEASPIPINMIDGAATMMLAGTMVDTTRFRSKVAEPTYKAMSYLLNRRASPKVATSMTRENYEQFKTKIKFLKNASNYAENICIAVDPDPDEIVDTTMLAMVASQAMTIAGNDAAFAIGRISPEKIGISARSNPKFNVEKIVKAFGGGGHFSSAAATVVSTDLEAVRQQLIAVLNDGDYAPEPSKKTDNRRRTLTRTNS